MGNSPSLVPIDLGALFDAPLKRFLAPVEPAIQKFLLVDRLGGLESVGSHLIRLAQCPALPFFFKGSNGLGFQWIGALHPRLRTADLPRQTLDKRGQSIALHIGRSVAA